MRFVDYEKREINGLKGTGSLAPDCERIVQAGACPRSLLSAAVCNGKGDPAVGRCADLSACLPERVRSQSGDAQADRLGEN